MTQARREGLIADRARQEFSPPDFLASRYLDYPVVRQTRPERRGSLRVAAGRCGSLRVAAGRLGTFPCRRKQSNGEALAEAKTAWNIILRFRARAGFTGGAGQGCRRGYRACGRTWCSPGEWSAFRGSFG